MTRIGLIGCGRWGRNAARAMAQAGVLAWVFDQDMDAARELAALHGVAVCDKPDSVDDVDGCWVCTPIPTHEFLVHELVSRGKHVLCEKPLARTKAQAQMLADEAKRAGVVLMADHTWRGHAGAMLAVSHRGVLAYHATRLAKDERGFDPLEDLLPHDVALSALACGRLDRVRVTQRGPVTRVTLATREQDRLAHMTYSYDSPTKTREVITWGDGDGPLGVNNGELPEGAPEPLAVILDTFLDAIERHAEPDIGGPAEFIHVAAVIEAAKKSRASGGEWVDVR